MSTAGTCVARVGATQATQATQECAKNGKTAAESLNGERYICALKIMLCSTRVHTHEVHTYNIHVLGTANRILYKRFKRATGTKDKGTEPTHGV